jgi:hypothetical protein
MVGWGDITGFNILVYIYTHGVLFDSTPTQPRPSLSPDRIRPPRVHPSASGRGTSARRARWCAHPPLVAFLQQSLPPPAFQIESPIPDLPLSCAPEPPAFRSGLRPAPSRWPPSPDASANRCRERPVQREACGGTRERGCKSSTESCRPAGAVGSMCVARACAHCLQEGVSVELELQSHQNRSRWRWTRTASFPDLSSQWRPHKNVGRRGCSMLLCSSCTGRATGHQSKAAS